MEQPDWENPTRSTVGMLLDGRTAESANRRPGGEYSLLLLVHAGAESVAFRLPPSPGAGAWQLLVTSEPGAPFGSYHASNEPFTLEARTLCLLRARVGRRHREYL
jgi:glycogen operon protein